MITAGLAVIIFYDMAISLIGMTHVPERRPVCRHSSITLKPMSDGRVRSKKTLISAGT